MTDRTETGATDLAIRVVVSQRWAEIAGAALMEHLGPYAEEAVGSPFAVPPSTGDLGQIDMVADVTARRVLVFYPKGDSTLSDSDILALLPEGVVAEGEIAVERVVVSRSWVDGWKDHFHPITIGQVRVRPPWEAPVGGGQSLVEVVINPGLGFGTGLHPTTRGVLTLLQETMGESQSGQVSGVPAAVGPRGALVDVGTGSGILSVAAAKLGWGPVLAFDNDAEALVSARENISENGVADSVELRECSYEEVPLDRYAGVTVLANMTLTPVLALLRRLTEARPTRLIVSGILAGSQESELLSEAGARGFSPGRKLHEAEWVSMELLPSGRLEGG